MESRLVNTNKSAASRLRARVARAFVFAGLLLLPGLSQANVSRAYDAAGNLAQRVDSSKSEPARTTSFSYDVLGRLTEVRDGAQQLIARYRYDPFDQRLSKELGDGTTTLYLHGEEGLLAETDAAGTVQRSYGWLSYGLYATAPLFQRTADGYFYYHNDHQGTPWRVTNKAGAVVWSASGYTAYGSATVASGAQIAQPWRLAGQYLDEETGLHYNLRRYYDAQAGRYLSEDPLRFEAAVNFYAYGNNSPGNFIDPTGEFAFLIPLAGNYLRCVAGCMALDAVGDLIQGECLSLDALGDCAKDCILGMLPLPTPCNKKFGQLVNGVVAAGSALSGGLIDGAAEAAANWVTNSFPGNTEVATPEGLKRIDALRPGDKVLAYAEWKGETQVEEVTDLVLSHHEQTIVTLMLASGEKLEATGGHPLHTPTGWRAAQLLQAGGQLDIKGPDGKLAVVDILRVEQRKEVIPVYNLEVSNSHTYFVGESGVLAHNVHGNSRASPLPQWVYEIYDKATGATRKFGVCNSKNKTRRPKSQLRDGEDYRYVDEIPAGPGARGKVYDSEQNLVDQYAGSHGGSGPPGNKLPQPKKP